ncbi:MAG: hypothetical protein OQK77_07805, partial [Psychromonas sp.]|nr:hypothetical protein [Psychromonas sp.]
MRLNKYYWLLAILVFTFSVLGKVAGATPVAWDQQQVWLSQQSQHFIISFLNGHQKDAARALDIAEQVHNELRPFFKSVPQQRTEIVLVDDYDFANGWALPLPFAQMRLIMSPPEDVAGLEVYDEWLHLLICHEYVHILHLELSEGLVNVLRQIFGRNLFLFPHALTPSLLLEGLAVYLETDKALGYGRLQGSFYEMQMRMQVAGGKLQDLQQITVSSREWPFDSPYLYGAYFIKYLVDTYGEEKLQLFLHNYSGQLLPYFLLNHSVKKVFGKDFFMLWRDFQVYLTARFANEITVSQQHPVIGNDLDKNLFLQVTGTGNNGLLVNRNNGEDRTEIALLNVDQDKIPRWQHLLSSKGIRAFAQHPDAGLVVSRKIKYADGRELNDLFRYQNE